MGFLQPTKSSELCKPVVKIRQQNGNSRLVSDQSVNCWCAMVEWRHGIMPLGWILSLIVASLVDNAAIINMARNVWCAHLYEEKRMIQAPTIFHIAPRSQ